MSHTLCVSGQAGHHFVVLYTGQVGGGGGGGVNREIHKTSNCKIKYVEDIAIATKSET